MSQGGPIPRSGKEAVLAARRALARGARAEACRLARMAAKLAPQDETAWLLLAAASENPRAGLAYVARALEINPKSRPAHKAVRWLVRRLPPREQEQVLQSVKLPADLSLRTIPVDQLAARRLLSPQMLLSATAVVVGALVWFGGAPADARPKQLANAPVAKASYTPTPTNTPTPTPTPTPTSTPTNTPTPSPTPTNTPRPAASSRYSLNPKDLADEGRWIDVDLGAQRVSAYEGARRVQSFVVSTGTWRYPTVTGQYRVYVKLRSTAMSGPGYYLPGVPYTMYFYKGYALHGTYWHNNFGTPMSHGCVNLRTPDAEWLFHFASVGTLVNVHP